MAKLYEEQAAAKYAQGQYSLGKLDQYDQRINITIDFAGSRRSSREDQFRDIGVDDQTGWKNHTSKYNFFGFPKIAL